MNVLMEILETDEFIQVELVFLIEMWINRLGNVGAGDCLCSKLLNKWWRFKYGDYKFASWHYGIETER